ncbi:MAG TPA: DMT family transporter [Dehalococcoidia bacterium]|nr:DMT family transporter [Dehalococcoidia bacterium]
MDSRIIIAIGITILLWASSFAAVRASLQAFTPGHIALFRFFIASIILAVSALVTHTKLPALKDIPVVFLLGFLGVFAFHTAQNYGQVTVTAGSAGMIISSVPIFTAILATIFLGEKLKLWGWLSIFISFLGVSLISLGEREGVEFDFGVIYLLMAAIVAAIYFVLQKPYLMKYTALQLVTYMIWAGTLLLLVFTPGLIEEVANAPIEATIATIYLGIFPSAVAYVTWSYALSRAPATIVASFLYLQPVLAVIIAWIWLNEIPALISMVGGVVTILGVFLVNKYGLSKGEP